jgi:hypothetical protein
VIVERRPDESGARRQAVAFGQRLIPDPGVLARFLAPLLAPLVPTLDALLELLELPRRDVLREHAPGEALERDFGVAVCHCLSFEKRDS